MTESTVLVKIGNTEIKPLIGFEVEPNKLWAKATRNLNGDLRARLIGIFPKLLLNIGYTTPSELETIRELLDDDFFTVTWYDEKKQTTVSGSYYAGDYGYAVYNKTLELYEPFKVNLIPVSKEA